MFEPIPSISIPSNDASPETLDPDCDVVVSGIHLWKKHKLEFWHTLMHRAAKTGGCCRVLSESLQDGLRLDDATVLGVLGTA